VIGSGDPSSLIIGYGLRDCVFFSFDVSRIIAFDQSRLVAC